MISEYNNLKWPFEETFAEETIFQNADEFILKVNELLNLKSDIKNVKIANAQSAKIPITSNVTGTLDFLFIF
jgi:hypothetical protein